MAGTASLDFFYSPANELTYNFSSQFTKVYQDIGDHVNFNPVIFLFSLPIDDPENCISGGLYCALDPGKLKTSNFLRWRSWSFKREDGYRRKS